MASFQSKWATGAVSSYMKTSFHQRGMKGIEMLNGFGKGIGLKGTAISLAWMVPSAYQAYQEEGAWGAVKSIGTDLAKSYIYGAVLGSAALPVMLATGLGAGVYAGASAIRDSVNDYQRKHARLELGSPVYDPFGNVGTMRQRSVNAIQNSRLNGRTALGNEAGLMYSPYFR